jgi:hypothetical protein
MTHPVLYEDTTFNCPICRTGRLKVALRAWLPVGYRCTNSDCDQSFDASWRFADNGVVEIAKHLESIYELGITPLSPESLRHRLGGN